MHTSVIIPTYRRPDRLVQAVNSVLAQTDPEFELIIICDGEDEESLAAIRPYQSDPRVRFLTQAHGGVSRARNFGIAHASGEWIAFLDDDDLWHPEKLKRQFTFMKETGYLVSQCDEIWIRHGVRVNPMKKHAKESGWIFEKCVALCAVSPSAVMIHREVLKDLGGFDEAFPVCEDYALWLRLSLRYPVGLLPEFLITKYGGHADQLSRKYKAMDAWRVKALEAILEDPRLNPKPEWKKIAIDSIRHRSKILYKGAMKNGNPTLFAEFKEKYETYRHACP